VLDVYFKEITVPKPNDLGGGNWNLSGLIAITTLFGKNGSGKSRLLRAWRDRDPKNSHYIIPERVGQLVFEPGFLTDETSSEGRRKRGLQNFLDTYRQRVVTRVQAYFMTRGAVRGKTMPGDPSDLEALLSTVLPDFDFTLCGSNPPYELSRRSAGQKVTDVNQLSSGEAARPR